jgi:predicted Zn-dependent protease with MMP-like domain
MRVTRRTFLRLAHEAWRELPEKVREAVHNVDIEVHPWPTNREIKEMGLSSPRDLLGLFVGIPRVAPGAHEQTVPNLIILFQRPIEESCSTKEELKSEIKKTLRHEIGHYLGMDERELEKLGYG